MRMAKLRNIAVIPITAIGALFVQFISPTVKAGPNDIGNKGAKVYCFMRSTGNSHAVSWDASYEIIKRQKSSLFKTSPKHAAVMIIETVVSNPDKYQNCGNYLGDLFSPPSVEAITNEETSDNPSNELEINEPPNNIKKGDRYSY